ncbi:MAG TPA: hypothetical protein VF190_08620, partial [Rhodothermales bacterium]
AAWARASLAFPQALSAEGSVGRKRSVPLAAGLSLVLPGAGQAYNGQWIKAAAGVAIEVAMIAAYATWKSDGEDGERAYQAYAHAFWSPARYALWLEDYSEWLPATEGVDIEIPTDIDFKNPDSWSVEQRARVRQLFDEIHAVEEEVYHPETGAAFSHKLPTFGSQQYYELIGKYFQFAPGWEDYEPWVDEEGNPIDGVIDPERTGPGGEKVNVKGRFRDYARDHAAANTLLRRASRMTSFLLINHVVAAIDAAVFARLHNGRVGTSVSLIPTPDGDVVPMASLRVAF